MKYIFWDIDDTLYDLEVPFLLAFKCKFGYIPENIHDIFLDFRKYNNEIYEKALTGEITMDELCIYRARMAFGDSGINISDENAYDFQMVYLDQKKNIYLNKYVKKVLDILKNKNVPMGIISNGPHKEQFLKYKYLGLEEYIPEENVIISSDTDFHKPQKEIFLYAKKKIIENTHKIHLYEEDSADNEFFYVGDSFLVDIVGASSAGFKPIWLNHRLKKAEKIDISFVEARSFKDLPDIFSKMNI